MTTGPGSSGATTLTAIVVNSTGDRTLRIVEDGALILPVVTVPERVSFPDVTVLLRALTDQHGIDAVALECLDRQESDHGPVELEALLELSPGSTIPAGAVWVTDLPARAALALARPAGHPATPAWSRPGWVTDALGWVTDRLVEAGQPLIRTPVQLRTWGLSAVFRCPTAGGPVYFKAAGHSSTIIPVGPEPRPLLFSHESGCSSCWPTTTRTPSPHRSRSTTTGSGCCSPTWARRSSRLRRATCGRRRCAVTPSANSATSARPTGCSTPGWSTVG